MLKYLKPTFFLMVSRSVLWSMGTKLDYVTGRSPQNFTFILVTMVGVFRARSDHIWAKQPTLALTVIHAVKLLLAVPL